MRSIDAGTDIPRTGDRPPDVRPRQPRPDLGDGGPAIAWPTPAERGAALSAYQPMLPLTDAERAALREDIRRHGVRDRVVLDEFGDVIEGHHRLVIADELGLTCPYAVVRGLAEADKLAFAARANLARRQAGPVQKGLVLLKVAEARGVAPGSGGDRRSAEAVAKGTIISIARDLGIAPRSATRYVRLARELGDEPYLAQQVDVGSISQQAAERLRLRKRQLGLALDAGGRGQPTAREAAEAAIRTTAFIAALEHACGLAPGDALVEFGRLRAARMGRPVPDARALRAWGAMEARELHEAAARVTAALGRIAGLVPSDEMLSTAGRSLVGPDAPASPAGGGEGGEP